MTCAKVKVAAKLTARNGQVFIGNNDCRTPQEVCPRAPGEGYEKCQTICHQLGHAEVMTILAAERAGCDVRGATIEVWHTHICEGCVAFCRARGVNWVLKNGEKT